ncbi:chloroquine resistance marker protein [Paenibacillus albidus]|nr:chloroquine resistance marker protein [Paenibacillus albidus]
MGDVSAAGITFSLLKIWHFSIFALLYNKLLHLGVVSIDRIKKELVLNLWIVSLVLSLLYSVLLISVNNSLVSGTPYVSDPGGAVVFVLFFLILYVFHLVLSLLSYAVTKNAEWMLTKKLFLFNVIGLALIGIVYFILKEAIVFFLISSLVIFSMISILNHRRNC